MSENNLLWHLLKATTKSKTDIWREFHLDKNKELPKYLKGKPKRRFTIPVLALGKTQWDESVFLLIHFSSVKPTSSRQKYFEISSNVITCDMTVDIQYVYMSNTRIGTYTEFLVDSNNHIIDYGKVKEHARDSILGKALELIKKTPRNQLIVDIPSKKYSKLTRKEWNHLIVIDQYTNFEKDFRGVSKNKK